MRTRSTQRAISGGDFVERPFSDESGVIAAVIALGLTATVTGSFVVWRNRVAKDDLREILDILRSTVDDV